MFVKQLSFHILFHFGYTAAIFICFFLNSGTRVTGHSILSFYSKTIQGRLG